MIYIANGMPKTGTHALLKGMELLGIPASLAGPQDGFGYMDHIPYSASPPAGKMVHIIRHPKNMLISWVRWVGNPVTEGMLIGAIQSYNTIGIAATLDAYQGWLSDANVHTVKYEDLVASAQALTDIATFLGVSYLVDAFANLPGLTETWTGSPSDYTTKAAWTANVDAAWTAAGIPARQAAFGY